MRRQDFHAKVSLEIKNTEEKYLGQLGIIKMCFEDPLAQSGLVPAHVCSQIFSNLDQLIGINEELHKAFNEQSMADAFLTISPYLKLYANYARSHEMALATLMEWEQKSKDFAAFRRAQEGLEAVGGLKLNALLITPVQRIPRYRLLLEELLKYTELADPDYPKIQECIKHVADVADYINTHMKEYDNRQRMLEIQKRLYCRKSEPPNIMEPGRVFIREGELSVVMPESAKPTSRMFFLFSDTLMYSRVKYNGAYADNVLLPLHKCSISTLPLTKQNPTAAPQLTGGIIKVSCVDENILMSSNNTNIISSWFEAINKAISVYRSDRRSLRKNSSGRQPLRGTQLAKLQQQEDRLAHIRRAKPRPNSALPQPIGNVAVKRRNIGDILTACTPIKHRKRRDSLL